MVPWFKPVSGSNLITDGLVSRWTFEDEGDTTTAVDSHGPYDMAISGASYVTTAQIGSHALSFDGTDDAISREQGDFHAIAETDPFTTTMWVHTTQVPSGDFDGRLFATEPAGSGQGYGHIFNTEGKQFLYSTGDNTNSEAKSNGTAVNDGSWHHLSCAFDQPNDTVTFYLDGSLDYEVTGYTDDITAQSDVNVYFGRHPTDSDWYDGLADDLRFYSRILTSTEVSTIANGNG